MYCLKLYLPQNPSSLSSIVTYSDRLQPMLHSLTNRSKNSQMRPILSILWSSSRDSLLSMLKYLHKYLYRLIDYVNQNSPIFELSDFHISSRFKQLIFRIPPNITSPKSAYIRVLQLVWYIVLVYIFSILNFVCCKIKYWTGVVKSSNSKSRIWKTKYMSCFRVLTSLDGNCVVHFVVHLSLVIMCNTLSRTLSLFLV